MKRETKDHLKKKKLFKIHILISKLYVLIFIQNFQDILLQGLVMIDVYRSLARN